MEALSQWYAECVELARRCSSSLTQRITGRAIIVFNILCALGILVAFVLWDFWPREFFYWPLWVLVLPAAIPILGLTGSLLHSLADRGQSDLSELRVRAWVMATSAVAIGLTLLFRPLFARELESGRKSICLDHMKQLASALQYYAADHEQLLPKDDTWQEDLEPYVSKPYVSAEHVLDCPAASTRSRSFVYNAALAGLSLDEVEHLESLVAFFESDAGPNNVGGPDLLPDKPRHFGGDNYGFADGHVTWVARKRLGLDKRGRTVWAKEPAYGGVIWEPVRKKPQAEAK